APFPSWRVTPHSQANFKRLTSAIRESAGSLSLRDWNGPVDHAALAPPGVSPPVFRRHVGSTGPTRHDLPSRPAPADVAPPVHNHHGTPTLRPGATVGPHGGRRKKRVIRGRTAFLRPTVEERGFGHRGVVDAR